MGGSVVFRVSGAMHVLEGFAVFCRVRRSPFFFLSADGCPTSIPDKSKVWPNGVGNPKP